MGQSEKKEKTDDVENVVDDALSPTSGQQTDIIEYVEDVKNALASLVDQVEEGQAHTSRMVEKTRDELSKQKTVSAKYTESLDDHIQSLQVRYDDQAAQLERLQLELDQKTQELQAFESREEESPSNEQEIVEYKNQLHEKEEANQAGKRRITALEETIESQKGLLDETQGLEQELAQQTQAIEVLTLSLADSQAALAPLQTSLDKATDAESTLQKELRDVHKDIAKLNYALDEEKKLRNKAESARDEALSVSQAQESQEPFRPYEERIAALETTEQASADTILQLKKDLRTAHKYNTQGREALETLQEEAKGTLDADNQKDERIQFLERKFSESQETQHAQQSVHHNLHEQIVTLEKQLKEALSAQSTLKEDTSEPDPRVDLELKAAENTNRLGQLLLTSGVITQAQLDEVLSERQHSNYDRSLRTGQQFIEKGYATEDIVAQAVAHQMEIPFLRIEHNTVKYSAVRLVSKQLAQMHQCMPLFVQAGNLVVAMVNPMDLIAIEDIEHSTGLPVKVMVSTPSDIQEAFTHYYQ